MKGYEKFERAYKRLNAEQRKAVDAIEGPVMVIAGPGTGKTEVLTMRIANILAKTDASPREILALTFTESGVTSMRKRLVDLIGTPAYQVTISTFHGFANSVIRNYPDTFPEIIGSTSITDVDQIRIIRDILDSEDAFMTLKPFGDTYYYVKSILASINELKRQGVSPESFKKIVTEEKKSFESIDDLYYDSGAHKGKMKGKYKDAEKHLERNKEFAGIYEKYQADLRKAKQYDYSDMIMYVMLALERDENLRLTLQEEHQYFLVDEHQDTNDAQNRIIELLASFHENPNLFVVGDEKQAIFRFQGASLANFFHFKKLYKNVTLISLQNNYRSTQAILDVAHTIVPSDITLSARAGHIESLIQVAELSSVSAEHFFLARKVRELIDAGVSPEEIAILYRENKEAGPLAEVLSKQGIPYNIESDQDVLGDEDIKKLLRVLRAVERFGSAPELAELLHVDFIGIPPFDIYRLFSYCGKNRHVSPYAVMGSPVLLEQAGVSAKERMQELFKNLSHWKNIVSNAGAGEAFETIVRESGFLASILAKPSALEKVAKLHALFDHLRSLIEMKKSYTLKDFFDYLNLIQEQDISIKSPNVARPAGRVRLMTAHKSKGLEFDYVFIINTVDGTWGSNRRVEHIRLPTAIYRTISAVQVNLDDDDAESDRDERNLFYVALTRAKKQVYLTHSKTRRDGREQLPTKFIFEIKEELLDRTNVSPYEDELTAHREIEFAPRPAMALELEDKAFLQELFKERGLSVTSLLNYMSCPWRYFYVNLIRIPEAPNKNLMYGNAVHEATKHYFDALAKGEDKGKEYLVSRFEEALEHQPIKQNDFEEALAKGKKSLSVWYDAYHDAWPLRTLNEFAVTGIELEPGTMIQGKIDKIELLESGSEVNVVDYKTGKPKTRNAVEGKVKSSDTNYKLQLVFYKLLLEREGKYTMVSGDIDFIEPDEKGKLHKEHFVISQGEVVELVSKIIEVSREIQNLVFWDRFCDDPECPYCALRKETIMAQSST